MMNEKKTALPSYEHVAQEGSIPAIYAPEEIGNVILELIKPIMTSIGKMLENNTQALEQLSAAQSVQNDRLKALEKQVRLQTPVTSKQVTYLNEAIRTRSRELLDKMNIEDSKSVTKLGNAIRKSVLARYGISTLREVPKHEYNIAMSQITAWNNALMIRDVVREARRVAELNGNGE